MRLHKWTADLRGSWQ